MMNALKYLLLLIFLPLAGFTAEIYVNQVAFDSNGPKMAVISTNESNVQLAYTLIDTKTLKVAYKGVSGQAKTIAEWAPGKFFYNADFSSFKKAGKYILEIKIKNVKYTSAAFEIGDNLLSEVTVPAILNYYHKQRANTPQELKADEKMLLYGSNQTVNVQGGWCDASGDISKYFSHLAYANFMSPQQIPLVTWSMTNTVDRIPGQLKKSGILDSLKDESIWGADYIMRSLSPEGYFYMTVFSYFNPDPKARRIVGLEADSKTTADYQCAFREGGGMAIAALARISRWNKDGDFKSAQYLASAKLAFDHLLKNNLKYTDDGKENIIDDYCALLAATELWIATDEPLYQQEARKRAGNLKNRMSAAGYFIADDKDRPFWHAADAGLPIIALARYLDKEDDSIQRTSALEVIKKALDYNLSVTNNVSNPFGYARQSFKFKGAVKDGFFIPHENETGWWWQGENARLGSLAAAAIVGGRLVYPEKGGWGVKTALAAYASAQLSWILGGNPYSMCFMYGFGKSNVPYMKSLYGHGSERGGISNGITGKSGNGDGSGIDFRTEDKGNEWRWTEQWIPHSAWFLQAVTAISEEEGKTAKKTTVLPVKEKRFKALVMAEGGGHHVAFSKEAKVWLDQQAAEKGFSLDYTSSTDQFSDEYLKQYQLIIQLDYAPYGWKDKSFAAFEKYINEGRGGWIGFHHATLLGDFDGFKMWPWFYNFMGQIKFKNYIPDFASGTVNVEKPNHPLMKGLPSSFKIEKEEWYTYDKSPRANVNVLASVDESTYVPNTAVKMGDHPVIWINPAYKARNVYIFMGHSPELFKNDTFKKLFENAISWAVEK